MMYFDVVFTCTKRRNGARHPRPTKCIRPVPIRYAGPSAHFDRVDYFPAVAVGVESNGVIKRVILLYDQGGSAVARGDVVVVVVVAGVARLPN